MNSRTITLEILRQGPPHNQLISPLTDYLAACQNRPPELLRLTVEHRDFLRWQAGLTYAGVRPRRGQGARAEDEERVAATSDVERRNAITDATKAVTNVLGSIRALIAELACEPCEWRHINLVLDASELGALPFELANAAPGLMVEGERLFAQQNARVTLTRQTRRIATSVVSWPKRPRILCVVANGDLPVEAHVLALRKSIDPWIGWNDDDPDTETPNTDPETILRLRAEEAEQLITVLEDPTIDEVSAATRRACYTHVHVLAHGAPLPNVGSGQTLYGLCFRGTDGDLDIVDGDRLEAALRQPRDCNHPTVVTIATCEGANVTGGILGPGGSTAHAIHAKGVPLVVASQFPLTKGASVIVTEMLYQALVRGDDPREALHAIRRELIVAYPDTHDWASLVMYASFPSDLDEQLRSVRRTVQRFAAETAGERLRVSFHAWRRGGAPEDHESLKKRVENNIERLDPAVETIKSWTAPDQNAATRAAGWRLLGRLALRSWDTLVFSKSPTPPPDDVGSLATEIGRHNQKHDFHSGRRPFSTLSARELLEFAKKAYEQAYFLDGSRWEIWVRAIALNWALAPQTLAPSLSEDLKGIEYLASLLVERADKSGTKGSEDRVLAAAIKFEVMLLSRLANGKAAVLTPVDPLLVAFDRFMDEVAPVSESYRAYSLWKWLLRYRRLATARDGNAYAFVDQFIGRLRDAGVRRFWGPGA